MIKITEVNPPAFLQNAGATHTAEITREIMNVLTGGSQHTTSQRARGGVNPSLGLKYSVFQNGSPNMSVEVGSGHALVPGSESPKQGLYSCFNDATVNKTIAASDPSLPRIDIVVLRVQDSAYSGAVNSWSIAVVTGTPASSPAVPTAPANSMILAQVAVGAGVTSIVNANITDFRPFLVAVGGIVPVRTKADRDALISAGYYDGFVVWRQDVNMFNAYDGADWRFFGRPSEASVATTQTTTSGSFTDLATSGPAVTLETGTTAKVSITCTMRNLTGIFQNRMSFAVSGASTIAANDADSIFQPLGTQARFTGTFLVTGLTAGTNTFTAKYRTDAGSNGEFAERQITVEAC